MTLDFNKYKLKAKCLVPPIERNMCGYDIISRLTKWLHRLRKHQQKFPKTIGDEKCTFLQVTTHPGDLFLMRPDGCISAIASDTNAFILNIDTINNTWKVEH